MNKNKTRLLVRFIVFFGALWMTQASFAWYAAGGGYHGNYYHGGYYGGNPYYHGVSNVYVGAPTGIGYYNSGYYAPTVYQAACQTYRVCNAYNQCWLKQECN